MARVTVELADVQTAEDLHIFLGLLALLGLELTHPVKQTMTALQATTSTAALDISDPTYAPTGSTS